MHHDKRMDGVISTAMIARMLLQPTPKWVEREVTDVASLSNFKAQPLQNGSTPRPSRTEIIDFADQWLATAPWPADAYRAMRVITKLSPGALLAPILGKHLRDGTMPDDELWNEVFENRKQFRLTSELAAHHGGVLSMAQLRAQAHDDTTERSSGALPGTSSPPGLPPLAAAAPALVR